MSSHTHTHTALSFCLAHCLLPIQEWKQGSVLVATAQSGQFNFWINLFCLDWMVLIITCINFISLTSTYCKSPVLPFKKHFLRLLLYGAPKVCPALECYFFLLPCCNHLLTFFSWPVVLCNSQIILLYVLYALLAGISRPEIHKQIHKSESSSVHGIDDSLNCHLDWAFQFKLFLWHSWV